MTRHELAPYDHRSHAQEQIRGLLLADLKRLNPDHRRHEKNRREAESARERIEQRLREIDDRYGDSQFAWREDQALLERYVAEHHDQLLAERDVITAQYTDFVADRSFIDHLREERPDLYARADQVFHYRALAVALRPIPPGDPSMHDHAKRLRHLIERYGVPEFAWREDQAKVEGYARRHAKRLSSETHRAAIQQAHESFHEDSAFINILQITRPDIYQRVDEVFFLRALALAESMDIDKPRFVPTPDEYRRRMLTRLRVQAEDIMSKAVTIETMVHKYRDDLEALGLEEDEIDEKVQLLRELLAEDDTTDSTDHSFKQL